MSTRPSTRSPPCQGYSIMHSLPWLQRAGLPAADTCRHPFEMLEGLGKPYVVENVMGSRHGSGARTAGSGGLSRTGSKAGWLCGAMFGLAVLPAPALRRRTGCGWRRGTPRHKFLRPRGIGCFGQAVG